MTLLKLIRLPALAFVAVFSMSLGMTQPAKAQSDPILGQVSLFGFNFCPRGWAAADGQLLPISQYNALFSLLGVNYGGDGRSTDPGRRSLAQVNHYSVKDTASYVVKNARGSAHQDNRGLNARYWKLNNFNSEIDLSLVKQSDTLRSEMDRLDALSFNALSTLRHKVLETHRDRFSELIAQPDNATLFEECNAFTK